MTSRNPARVIMGCLFTVAWMSTSIALQPKEVTEWPRGQVEQSLPAAHPMAYYLYAARLFHEGDKDDALFWYYVGEIRSRFYLAANPNLSKSGDPGLLASLHQSVGSVIVEWGRTVPNVSAKQLRRALDWDASNDNGFTSKSSHRKLWQDTRGQFDEIEAQLVNKVDAPP